MMVIKIPISYQFPQLLWKELAELDWTMSFSGQHSDLEGPIIVTNSDEGSWRLQGKLVFVVVIIIVTVVFVN